MKCRLNARPALTATAVSLCTLLGACAAAPKVQELPATGEVQPIERPVYATGTVFKQVSATDGSVADWEVIETNADGSYVGRNSEGCTWTSSDPMAPGSEWSGCGSGEWSSGTTVTKSADGNLWPLETGNTATWDFKSTSGGGSVAEGKWKCVVSGPFALSARVGEVDAMKVVCKDHWATKTSYWNAEFGEIRTFRSTRGDGLQYDHELVSVERR